MILEFMSAFCFAFAGASAVLLSGLQAFLAVISFTALALLIAWITVKRHERSRK